jgi:muramoyltetrapeptide carboxypeptidase
VIIKPPSLRPGDTIGIIAPAGPVARDEIQPAIDLLKERGYHTLLSLNLFNKKGYLAGRDEARLEDFHAMFGDSSVKAILCARGGFGTIRLLDGIDYDLVRSNPKVIAGYSDITALLIALFNETGLITFHGPVLRNLARDPEGNLDSLLETTSSGEPRTIDLSGGTTLKRGSAKGMVIGGNLSLTCSLIGTPYLPDLNGAILFIEDTNEPTYRIDRMLTHLRLAGVIRNLSGLIAGDFTGCGEPEEINRLLREITHGVNIPVVDGLPVGHGTQNKTIPMGISAELDTKNMMLTFLETCAIERVE